MNSSTVKIIINVKKNLHNLHWNKKQKILSTSQVSRKVLEDIREFGQCKYVSELIGTDGLDTRLQPPKEIQKYRDPVFLDESAKHWLIVP